MIKNHDSFFKRKDEHIALANSELNRKHLKISEYQTYAKANVQDIVSTMRRMVNGKRIHVYVYSADMDNVWFHNETSVQNWKYVVQRRIAAERELSKKDFDYKEIMKVVGLMKTATSVGPCYENLVKEFREVYDRGKCMNFSPSIINWAEAMIPLLTKLWPRGWGRRRNCKWGCKGTLCWSN